MTNDREGTTGRTSNSSPMGSTVAIVVAVLAVVAGFFILRTVRDDDPASPISSTTLPGGTTTTSEPTETSSSAPGVTTTLVLITEGTQVQVANASNQDGVAKQLSTALAAKSFDMADPTNGAERSAVTKVFYVADDPAAQDVANSIAVLLGGVPVEEASSPVPTQSGALPAGCGVLVLLGSDKAGKTLEEMGGVSASNTTTTSDPAITVTP